jgi:hypothetical protein
MENSRLTTIDRKQTQRHRETPSETPRKTKLRSLFRDWRPAKADHDGGVVIVPIGNIELNENMEVASPPSTLPVRSK